MRNVLRMLPLGLLACVLAGCIDPAVDQQLMTAEPPADFTVEVVIRGEPGANDRLRRSGRYLLEADRTIRVMHGPVAVTKTYPPAVDEVTPDAQLALYRLIKEQKLMEATTTPDAKAALERRGPGPTVYLVEIIAGADAHRFQVTPEESEATVALLSRMIELGEARRQRGVLQLPVIARPAETRSAETTSAETKPSDAESTQTQPAATVNP